MAFLLHSSSFGSNEECLDKANKEELYTQQMERESYSSLVK